MDGSLLKASIGVELVESSEATNLLGRVGDATGLVCPVDFIEEDTQIEGIVVGKVILSGASLNLERASFAELGLLIERHFYVLLHVQSQLRIQDFLRPFLLLPKRLLGCRSASFVRNFAGLLLFLVSDSMSDLHKHLVDTSLFRLVWLRVFGSILVSWSPRLW